MSGYEDVFFAFDRKGAREKDKPAILITTEYHWLDVAITPRPTIPLQSFRCGGSAMHSSEHCPLKNFPPVLISRGC